MVADTHEFHELRDIVIRMESKVDTAIGQLEKMDNAIHGNSQLRETQIRHSERLDNVDKAVRSLTTKLWALAVLAFSGVLASFGKVLWDILNK